MLFEENIKKLEEEEQVTEEAPAEEEVGKIKKRRGRRPKRKIDEIASMAEDDAEEDLDPFNYSLDRIYANASRALAKVCLLPTHDNNYSHCQFFFSTDSSQEYGQAGRTTFHSRT